MLLYNYLSKLLRSEVDLVKNFIYKTGDFIDNNKVKFKKFFKLSIFIFMIMVFIIQINDMSCDKSFHMLRLNELASEIKLNGLLNYPYYINFSAFNNFGYATELFYGDIFLIPFALLINLGLSVNIVYSFLIAISFLMIFISMYYAYKYYYKDKDNAFNISYLYTFSNYIIFELTERNALGTNFSYIFIPWAIFSFLNIINNKEKKYDYIIFGLAVNFLFLSHVQTCVVVILGLIIYCIFNIKNLIKYPKIILTFIKSILIFFLSNAFFIFPMIEQMAFQKLYISTNFTYKLSDRILFFLNLFVPNHFWRRLIPLEILLAPSKRLDRIFRYSISPSCFIPFLFMIIFNLLTYKKLKKDDKNKPLIRFSNITVLFCILASFTGLISYISLFNFLQFPWRVLTLAAIFMPIGFILSNKENIKIIYFACILTFINAFCYLIILGLWNANYYNEITIGNGEYLPTEVPSSTYAYDYKNDSYTKEIIKNGYSIVINNNTSDNNLELPIVYYKGYNAYINNEKADIKKSKKGLIEINNSQNADKVIVKYDGTIIQKVTKYISLSFYIGLIGYIIYDRKKHNSK